MSQKSAMWRYKNERRRKIIKFPPQIMTSYDTITNERHHYLWMDFNHLRGEVGKKIPKKEMDNPSFLLRHMADFFGRFIFWSNFSRKKILKSVKIGNSCANDNYILICLFIVNQFLAQIINYYFLIMFTFL